MLVLSEKDKEYLKRPLVKDIKYEIDKNRIYIISESTGFFNCTRMKGLKQEDILSKYSEVIKKCRTMGIKIKYSFGFKKFVLNNWSQYIKEIQKYNKMFDIFCEKVKELLIRGIHVGFSDDEYLKECTLLSWELLPFTYRDSIISKINDIYKEILKHLDYLEREQNGDKSMGQTICIYL